MQTERSPSNVPSANNARPRRRPSHINLSNVNNNALSTDLLSPRTPRSITKSRRSSVVAEHVQEVFQSESRSSSRRGSLVTTPAQPWPPLLSDSTNSYFQDMIAQDDEQPNPDSPYLRARMSSEDMLGNASGPNASSNRTRSSSLTSLLGSAHLVNLPSFDVHTLYKLKTTKTSKKLDHFFGEHAPHDICIKEIRKEGLKAILESKSPLCYFLYHLLQEYSSENLFFFIELEQYETFTYISLVQQLATAQHIYNTYLTRNSYFEVNLDDKVRRTVTQALEQKNAKNCFDTAKRAVYALLESSFMRFQSTEVFQEMVANCGELTTHYDEKARTAAVNRLLSYVEREHELLYTNPHTDSPVFQSIGQTTRRRHELIKSMIHEFCRTLVGVEFNYYRPDDNNVVQPQSDQSPKGDPETSPGTKFRPFGKKK